MLVLSQEPSLKNVSAKVNLHLQEQDKKRPCTRLSGSLQWRPSNLISHEEHCKKENPAVHGQGQGVGVVLERIPRKAPLSVGWLKKHVGQRKEKWARQKRGAVGPREGTGTHSRNTSESFYLIFQPKHICPHNCSLCCFCPCLPRNNFYREVEGLENGTPGGWSHRPGPGLAQEGQWAKPPHASPSLGRTCSNPNKPVCFQVMYMGLPHLNPLSVFPWKPEWNVLEGMVTAS